MSKTLIFTDLHAGSDISGKGKEGINTHGFPLGKVGVLDTENNSLELVNIL